MSEIINVTDAAIEELKRLAESEGKDLRIRAYLRGGGCSGHTIEMDFTKWPADEEHDLIQDVNGIEFVIDEKSAFFMQDAILDFGGGLLDRGFKWTFPKSSGGCGCGVSFSF